MSRARFLLGVAAAASMMICACGGPAPIAIGLTTPPPSSIEVNRTADIAATVINDPSNSGVDWSCAPANSCGTFTPTHTASGFTTVYQAPAASGSVTITAASTKKPTVTVTASVTINPIGSTSNLTGTYTFFANGWDTNGNSTSVAGSIVLNGTGSVMGGEEDYFDATAPDVFPQDTITGGTITLGSDGRGTLTLNPKDLGAALGAAETFSIVLVNNKHLLITEFDGNATSAGSMDLQTAPASVPTGGNAFNVMDTWDAFVWGGVITSDGTSAITTGEGDDDYQGAADYDNGVTGSFTPPDPAGRGTITLTNTVYGDFQFAYYVVGPEAFRLIEVDGTAFNAGSIYGQGTAAGAYSAASLQGTFVFSQAGESGVGIFYYGAAGQFTADGASKVTSGVADVNMGDGGPVLAGNLAVGSSYAVSANGYGYIALPGATTDGLANFGIYMVDPGLNIADPNSTTGGGGALMTDLDVNSLGVGMIVPQATAPTFAGNYAFNQDGVYQTQFFSFYDILGQVVSDGASNLTGLADYNDLGNTGQNANVAATGVYTADATHPGRSTAKVTVGGAPTLRHITIYQANSNLLLHVDTDSSSYGYGIIGVGVFEKQQ